MQNIFIDVLPPWVETGLQPAFYDLESGTVLQQTARMYAKVRELTEAFNTFTENVTDIVNEYIGKFNELYTYVHDYFDNLDVQEEINNKLDDMVEDGTLQEIIFSYIQANVQWTFDTVAEMVLAPNLTNGSYAQTLGFYSKNDKGGAIYVITDRDEHDTANSYTIFIGDDYTAHLVAQKEHNIKQFGAKGDGSTDDTTSFQEAVDFTSTNYSDLYIDSGNYPISQVTCTSRVKIYGNNAESVISSTADNSSDSLIKLINGSMNYSEISNIRFNGQNQASGNLSAIKLYSQSGDTTNKDRFTNIHDLSIFNMTGSGIVVGENGNTRVREVRITNVTVGGCKKKGIETYSTDSIYNGCTAEGNIEEGFYIMGASNRIIGCKAFYNGKGDETTADIARTPASGFTATSDVSPVAGKSYYTRSGSGVNNDWYKFTLFTGNTFDGGTTYYENTKVYYLRYAGYRLSSRNSVVACESQENYGDGMYMTGSDINISTCRFDNNGLLTDSQGNVVSYASQSMEQLYYGIYTKAWRTSIDNCSFLNYAYSTYGASQKAPVMLDGAYYFIMNGGIANQQVSTTIFLQSVGDLRYVNYDCNNESFVYTLSTTEANNMLQSGFSWYVASGNQPRITYRNGIVRIQGTIEHATSILNGTTSVTLFVLPTKLRPSLAYHGTVSITDNHGYTNQGNVNISIETNGYASVRCKDTSLNNYKGVVLDIELSTQSV